MISLTAIVVLLLTGWLARRAWKALARTMARRAARSRAADRIHVLSDNELDTIRAS